MTMQELSRLLLGPGGVRGRTFRISVIVNLVIVLGLVMAKPVPWVFSLWAVILAGIAAGALCHLLTAGIRAILYREPAGGTFDPDSRNSLLSRVAFLAPGITVFWGTCLLLFAVTR